MRKSTPNTRNNLPPASSRSPHSNRDRKQLLRARGQCGMYEIKSDIFDPTGREIGINLLIRKAPRGVRKQKTHSSIVNRDQGTKFSTSQSSEKTLSSRPDQRRKLLLRETDAGQDPHGVRAA